MDDIIDKDRRKADEKDVPRAALVRPKDPWLVDVDVYLEDVTDPDNPKFRLETYLPIDPANPDKVITFHNCGRPGFDIRFNLIDETGTEPPFLFPPQNKKDEALWSRQGSGCPPKDHNDQWDEFTARRVIEPDQETLVVHNKNETVTEFGYTLRVTNDNGVRYVNLDPGGNNQNGNPPLVAR